MKRKRIMVMWMPSVNSRSRVFSIPPSLFYLFLTILAATWILLAVVGFMGNRLYRQYVELRQQNSQLLQKQKELEALRQSMERIQKDENIIRNFLGLDQSESEPGALGQGGEPSPDLSTIAPSDAKTSSSLPCRLGHRPYSLVQTAQSLQNRLAQLVETMREQRQLWDSTPSIVPVQAPDYWFSSGFGWRRSPFTGLREFHNGLDISGRKGTPIIAPANGTVVKRGYDKYLGKYLQIDHGRGIITTYGHLSDYKVSCGQKVTRGEVIALMGNSGLSTGNHLHYMIKVNDRCVNPLHYILNARASRLLVRRQQAEGGSR